VFDAFGPKRLLRRREFVAASAWAHLTGEPGSIADATVTTMEAGTACNANSANGVTVGTFGSAATPSALSRDSSTSGPASFTVGSEQTRACVSRYGAQDLVGNVEEWTSDRVNCNDTSCAGTAGLGLDSGSNSGGYDLSEFRFDGSQGPGGSNTAYSWTLASKSYCASYLSRPLALPWVNGDVVSTVQQAFNLVTGAPPLLTSDQLHADTVSMNPDTLSAGVTRGVLNGGSYTSGDGAGRFYLNLNATSDTSTSSKIGFRCAIQAE